jgi:hypothetical protein
MRPRTPSPLLGLLLLGALPACARPAPRDLPADEARALLIDRNWLDVMPQGPRDRLHVFRFVPRMGGGVYQDRTLFAGQFELFTFSHSGGEIRFHMPHTGERRTVAYRIGRVAPGEDREPFDIKLQLDGSPRGPDTYYSVRSETGATPEALDGALRRLHQR